MKRNLILGLLVVAGFPFFSACDDDDPPPPAMLNFEIAEQEVTESDGTLESFHPALVQDALGKEVEVKITLDKPAADVSVISYSVSGTAQKTSPGNPLGDYNIDGNNFTIEKGATEAILTVTLYEDGSYEYEELNADNIPFEDIIITLESVVSGPVQIGETSQFTLNVIEDDALLFLVWDPQDDDSDGTGDVDMDMFVWLDEELWDYTIFKDTDTEFLIICGGFPSGEYSMSYTYYSGASNDLDFQAVMFGDLNGNIHPYPEGDPLFFNGHYTQANINVYHPAPVSPLEEAPSVQIVQSMTKSGTSFNNISEITAPSSGSRIAHSMLKKVSPAQFARLIKRAESRNTELLKRISK